MTQHALRWALAQPGVVSALVGVKREEQIDEAAGGSGVLPQGALCEEAVERLLGCGVLRRGQDGALRWIHSVHAPRPLDDVRPMASADWYV